MMLASYKSIRPGLQGVANVAIRLRTSSLYSHSEIIFMPGDGIDHRMPDGTCEPIDGAYWSASSVAAEVLPGHSPRRAGHKGGVRIKRIKFDPDHWDLVPLHHRDPKLAMEVFIMNQGKPYDWQLVAREVVWMIPQKASRKHCAEQCAEMLGVHPDDSNRFTPATLSAMALADSHMVMR